MSLLSSSRRCVIAVLLAAAPVTLGLAAESGDVAVRGLGGGEASPLATLLRLSAALCVVLLVFWGCARLVRRLNGAGLVGGGAAQAGLRVVGALSLGGRERLVLVQAGEEQLLLGVTATHIERLHLLPTPLSAPGDNASGPFDSGDFRAKLLSAMNRRTPS